MSINTGQITTKTRKNLFTRINILTFILIILLKYTLTHLDSQINLLYTAIQFLFQCYLVYASLILSRPHYRIEYMKKQDRSSQLQYVNIETNNRINIGESIVGFLRVVFDWFWVFGFVMIVEVVVRYGLWLVLELLVAEQKKLGLQVWEEISRNFRGNPSYEDVENYIDNIGYLNMPGLKKINKQFYLILVVSILTIFMNYVFFCLKYVLFAHIERIQHMKKNAGGDNRRGRNVELDWGLALKYLWVHFIRWKVISAYIRLFFRLVWIYLFIQSLEPYFYFCFGFLYRRVVESDFKLWVIQNELTIIKTKQEQDLRRQKLQKSNQEDNQSQNKQSENEIKYQNITITFHNDQNTPTKFQNEGDEHLDIFRKIHNNDQQQSQQNSENQQEGESGEQEEDQEDQGDEEEESSDNQNENQSQESSQKISSQVEIILENQTNLQQKNPMLNQLFNKIKKNKVKKHRKIYTQSPYVSKFKIQRLIYRPSYNDVIEVRRF